MRKKTIRDRIVSAAGAILGLAIAAGAAYVNYKFGYFG